MDPEEYWEYLHSGKTWDNSRSGLINFILECYYEMHFREWKINRHVSFILSFYVF